GHRPEHEAPRLQRSSAIPARRPRADSGTPVSTPIDWEQLAREVGSLREDGEHCSSDLGLRALEVIVGEDRLRAAVDYYVAGGRGSELARFVLLALHPSSALCPCYEIYPSHADVPTRC